MSAEVLNVDGVIMPRENQSGTPGEQVARLPAQIEVWFRSAGNLKCRLLRNVDNNSGAGA